MLYTRKTLETKKIISLAPQMAETEMARFSGQATKINSVNGARDKANFDFIENRFF